MQPHTNVSCLYVRSVLVVVVVVVVVCEFRRATTVVGDAVNIYRLSLRATSCLTKINYSSRGCGVARNIIEPCYL
jgi:hypothetical protein